MIGTYRSDSWTRKDSLGMVDWLLGVCVVILLRSFYLYEKSFLDDNGGGVHLGLLFTIIITIVRWEDLSR